MSEQFLHGIQTVEVTTGPRPILTARSSVIGVIGTAPNADPTAWPLNRPVLIAGDPHQVATLGTAGTLPAAIDDIFDQRAAIVVVVRVEANATQATELANVVGLAAQGTGVHAFAGAESIVKVTPRLLCAPGFTAIIPNGASANPVIAELLPIARRLRAVVFADGPGTTDAAAIAHAEAHASDRLQIIDPGVLVFDPLTATTITRPASARAAGLQARIDNEFGFWWSYSNQPIDGVVGASRPIGFSLTSPTTPSNLLNEQGVTTLIHKDGFRFWGLRSTATDPLWSFLAVRRTADMIYESIEQAMLWAMARPLTRTVIEDIAESVNAYLRYLKAVGAILGGRAWIDPNLNPATQLQAGRLTVDFDIEPPAPLERLTFRAHRNGEYYEELISEVARALAG